MIDNTMIAQALKACYLIAYHTLIRKESNNYHGLTCLSLRSWAGYRSGRASRHYNIRSHLTRFTQSSPRSCKSEVLWQLLPSSPSISVWGRAHQACNSALIKNEIVPFGFSSKMLTYKQAKWFLWVKQYPMGSSTNFLPIAGINSAFCSYFSHNLWQQSLCQPVPFSLQVSLLFRLPKHKSTAVRPWQVLIREILMTAQQEQ